MKKTKFVFMLITMVLLLISCGSDDSGADIGNPSADLIVGNWSYIGDIDEDGFEEDEHEPCDDEFLKFKSDGTVRNTINYCNEATEVVDLFWEKAPTADKYIFSNGNQSVEEAKVVFSQSNNRMTIYEDESGLYAIVYQRQ